MSERSESTTVEIYGETYNVRGEGDPAYLMELARFVDSRMREVASQVSIADRTRIAILAALNIADELSRYKERQRTATESWKERTEELAERLGRTVAEEPARAAH